MRDRLGSILLDAGWHVVVGGEESRPDLLSYSQDDAVLRFRWAWTEGGYTLIFERREPGNQRFQQIRARAISDRALHRLSPPELRRRLDSFIEDVTGVLSLESNR